MKAGQTRVKPGLKFLCDQGICRLNGGGCRVLGLLYLHFCPNDVNPTGDMLSVLFLSDAVEPAEIVFCLMKFGCFIYLYLRLRNLAQAT